MRWLVPKSDESHEKALKLWTPDTGNWLIEHADFVSWVEGPHRLLWLNGIRKSCLAEIPAAGLISFPNYSWVRQDYLDVRTCAKFIVAKLTKSIQLACCGEPQNETQPIN